MKNFCSVGVFDSGIGGLNVLNACQKAVNNVNFVYFGDNKNAPYGNKDLAYLKKRANYIVNIFRKYKISNVVIACNTLSVSLGDYLIKTNKDINFVLTLPIRPSEFKNPILLSTPLTSKSDYVKNLYLKNEVVPLPFLAREIEDNIFNFKNINIKNDLKGIPKNADCVVLGCTHYLYLKKVIKSLVNMPVVSGIYDVADNLKNLLLRENYNIENSSLKKINLNNIIFIGESANYNKKVYNSFFK